MLRHQYEIRSAKHLPPHDEQCLRLLCPAQSQTPLCTECSQGLLALETEDLWILIQANCTTMSLEVLVGLLIGLVLANLAELVS